MKKVIIFGGGNAMSTVLRGLKQFPIDIVSVVTVSDDGKSTGRLREEFNTPAVGDIRRVLISLSETEPLVEKLFNYRFDTDSDLNGHAVGNLLLTATTNMTGNLSEGISSLSKVLNLKGKVLPLTEDNATLKAKLEGNKIIEGEANITADKRKIKKIYYKKTPKVNKEVLKEIKQADLILLSSGSLYTSIIPHLILKDIKEAIDTSSSPIAYISNIMTQPGETDHFTVNDHINVLNSYLGKRKIDLVFVNNGKISKKILNKYLSAEQKDPVGLDQEKLNKKGIKVILNDYILVEDEMLRHDSLKLALDIYSYLLFKK